MSKTIRVLWSETDNASVTIKGANGVASPNFTVNGSAITFPYTVSASTSFVTKIADTYTVSVNYFGREIANTPDGVRKVDLTQDGELVFAPSPDTGNGGGSTDAGTVLSTVESNIKDPTTPIGSALSAAYVGAKSPSVVLFGDSLTAQNGTGPNTLDPANGPSDAVKGRGYAIWANAYMGQRFNIVYNAGVGGQVTSQMLARIQTDVVAKNTDWVWFCGGANDVATDVPLATIQSNITSILSALTGKSVLILTVPPSTSFNTTSRKSTVANLNKWIRALPLSYRNVVVVDTWRTIVDPSTDYPATGMAYDGVIHWSESGAMRVGKAVSDALSPLVAARPSPFLMTDPAGSSVIGNPYFGTSGNGWSLLGAGVTVAYGTAPDRWSNQATLTLTGVTDTTERGIQYVEPIANGRYAAGDIVQATARFQWSNAVAVTSATGTFRPFVRIWPRLSDNTFTTYAAQAMLTPSSELVQPNGYETSGDLVAITDRITLPANVANLYVAVGWQGMASGSIVVSDLAVYKNA